jgi:hypothetical protein
MRRLAVAFGLGVAGCGVLLGIEGDDEDAEIVFPSDGGNSSDDGTSNGEASGDVSTSAVDSGGDAGDAALPAQRRVVFVTQRRMAGDFGGLAAGDTICAAEAADAGLGGQFVAWLSNGSPSFNAKSRFVTDAGWYLTGDGGEVFSGPAAMTNLSAPKVGIDRTAHGQTIGTGQVWTGLWGDGVGFGKDCAGWTTTSNDGVPGNIGVTTTAWTGAAPDFCTAEKRLICFQK